MSQILWVTWWGNKPKEINITSYPISWSNQHEGERPMRSRTKNGLLLLWWEWFPVEIIAPLVTDKGSPWDPALLSLASKDVSYLFPTAHDSNLSSSKLPSWSLQDGTVTQHHFFFNLKLFSDTLLPMVCVSNQHTKSFMIWPLKSCPVSSLEKASFISLSHMDQPVL